MNKPDYVTALEAAYGAPSREAFGSAVFFARSKSADDLEKMALEKYRYFVGDLWERYGEAAWLGTWKKVYVRGAGAKHDIVAELRGIKDPDAAISVPMILDNFEGAGQAGSALSAAYDTPAVNDLQVFNLGDGGAMSGLLIAGRQDGNGELIFLVFLMDWDFLFAPRIPAPVYGNPCAYFLHTNRCAGKFRQSLIPADAVGWTKT